MARNSNSVCGKCGRKKTTHKHHVISKRFKKLLKELFPKEFNGEKNIDYLCYECHQGNGGVENIIPKKNPLLPEYYRELNRMFLAGLEITNEQIKSWVVSSTRIIEMRKKRLNVEAENLNF